MKERNGTHLHGHVGNGTNGDRKIRYAVVGLGHIAQAAILPAFANARGNSELTALVSDDPAKLRALSRHYGVKNCFTYKDYEKCLKSGSVDAAYIAVPNNLHEEFCVRTAQQRVHVLVEKPLAPTTTDCEKIIRSCSENHVKLMTAYRLHFERANLEATEIIQSGQIGEPRIFNSVFTMQVAPGNMRTDPKHAGGPLYDIGVYCINAARYLFRGEPTQGVCLSASNKDPRFRKVEEMIAAILRFPKECLASFTASFGARDTADFEIVGTEGKLRAIQAYEYTLPVRLEITRDGRVERKTYGLRDQFGPEIVYFSDCILHNRRPEPSGFEGLRDVRIIQALQKSAKKGMPVKLEPLSAKHYPGLEQEIYRPKVNQPRLIHVQPPAIQIHR
jgi:glucose-fructose oxidoreductase